MGGGNSRKDASHESCPPVKRSGDGRARDGGDDVAVKSRKPLRDAVTGEILTDANGVILSTAGRYYISVREERVERIPTPAQRASGERIETTPIPWNMHTARVEGRLGGHCWTPEFTRYIGSHRTREIEEADRELREWWTTPYARRRVANGFVAKYGPERGAQACLVALATLFDPDCISDLAEQCGHTANWVVRQRSLAYRFAFAKSA